MLSDLEAAAAWTRRREFAADPIDWIEGKVEAA
jgi:hypothetical protein